MQTIRTNLTNAASTQYTNFDFTSMCLFNGVKLGAGPGGLFKVCCGDTDNTVDIDAYFIPATSDFNAAGEKTVINAYFSMECAGSMAISLTGNNKTTAGPYLVSALSDEGSQRRRVDMGRGLKFSYGSFKIENTAGADFSIDRIDILMNGLSGRK